MNGKPGTEKRAAEKPFLPTVLYPLIRDLYRPTTVSGSWTNKIFVYKTFGGLRFVQIRISALYFEVRPGLVLKYIQDHFMISSFSR